MTRPLAVLRPAPGNEATARRIEAAGHAAIRLPLFEVVALPWTPPDPAVHDALVLTSANAIRHAGAALVNYTALPVYAVGEATAAAAHAAGLAVAAVGEDGVEALLARAHDAGARRALHLAGRERSHAELLPVTATVAVYASEPLPAPALSKLAGSVALVHSRRAALRLADLVSDRAGIAVAALSQTVAQAAGAGWRAVAVAAAPTDAALIAAALTLSESD